MLSSRNPAPPEATLARSGAGSLQGVQGSREAGCEGDRRWSAGLSRRLKGGRREEEAVKKEGEGIRE